MLPLFDGFFEIRDFSDPLSRDVDSDSDSHPDSVDSNDFGGLGLGLAFEKNVGLGLGLAFFQSSHSNIFWIMKISKIYAENAI